MPRFTFGPTIGTVTLAAPAPAPEVAAAAATATPVVTKEDVVVTFAGYTAEGVFAFAVPEINLATQNQLAAIHVFLFPVGATPSTDPNAIVADKSLPSFRTDTSTTVAAQTFTVDCTAAPKGEYDALTILEWPE
jgi:hypothetical protein